MKQIKEIILDGKKYGITVEITNKNKKKKFIYSRNRNTKLLKNLSIAKVLANQYGINSNDDRLEIKYYFVIDDNLISLNSCQKIGDIWETYTSDFIYHIYEDTNSNCLSLGYIVTRDGDTKRCEDKAEGIKYNKNIISIVRDNINSLLLYGDADINSIIKSKGELTITLKGSTGRIHILNNSKLMDVNQARKAENKRCLPFLKQMDKFTTLYMYSTKDLNEPRENETDAKLIAIQEFIVNSTRDFFNEEDAKKVRYIPVNFNGYINIEEG